LPHRFGIDREADSRWLALTRAIYHGARSLDAALARFPSPEALLGAESPKSAYPWLDALQKAVADAPFAPVPKAWLEGPPVHLITTHDASYPLLLAECNDRPPFLFVRGNLDCLNSATVSVVGTRKPSLDGRRATEEYTRALAHAGLTVVSGLALGVDGLAHTAAVIAGAQTIAVLPSGIDRIYPARHQPLADEIMKSGALVSEFPLGTAPRRHHFYRRNRTLSGFSAATLVIEAGRPSGTLITASAAADQGRDVLALPWSVYHAEGAGCRYLLEDGAILTQSTEALLLHLGVDAVRRPAASDAALVADDSAQRHLLSPQQKHLVSLLGCGAYTADDLAVALGWPIDQCLATLVDLEVRGWVSQCEGGYCVIR